VERPKKAELAPTVAPAGSCGLNQAPTIFLGVFLTFASAWLGLVVAPYLQLAPRAPDTAGTGAAVNGTPQEGLAAQGRDVYRANGCIYCHSQQVRPEGFGADIARGWGPRRTVAQDYFGERPVLLGTMRTGPDLANIGARQPSATSHHLHLYNPRITAPGSIMPRFAFLYERRKILGERSAAALKLPPGWDVEPGYEVVPRDEAKALVAYLLVQNRTGPLEETGP
jgi:cytochrome c oxidase cbb3-type subunit 2